MNATRVKWKREANGYKLTVGEYEIYIHRLFNKWQISDNHLTVIVIGENDYLFEAQQESIMTLKKILIERADKLLNWAESI